MKSLKIALMTLTAGVINSVPSFAQSVRETADLYPESGNFFTAVIAGVLLAMGFQLLLTNLSVALGITAVGNIEDKVNEGAGKHEDHEDKDFDEHGEEKKHAPILVKISGALGAWTLLTVSISLFFASMLAVKLSLVPAAGIGVTLGLVIWATFFTAMAILEAKSISSLAGGVWHTAMHGFQSAFGAARGVTESSAEAKAEKIARRAARVLREELIYKLDTGYLERKLDHYIARLQPHPVDPRTLRHEIANLLNDLEIRENHEQGTYGTDRHFHVKVSEKQPFVSGDDVKSFANASKDAFSKVREANAEHERPADKVMSAVDKLTPGSEEDSRKFREKVEEYLKNTRREELNPESIKRDIDRIFQEPGAAKEVIMSRIQQLNPSTLVSVLTRRNDVSTEDAARIVENMHSAFSALGGRISETAGSQKQYARDRVAGAAHNVKERPATWVEEKVAQYLHSIDRPEFDYKSIKEDFSRMFHDPKATPEVLKERFSQYDRESLIALLSTRMPREEAERTVSKIEETRDNLIHKAEETQTRVRAKIHEARQAALHQAENTRVAAATAAWWLFATAVVSGAASAVGGVLAM